MTTYLFSYSNSINKQIFIDMDAKAYREIKIKELTRDIKIMEDIESGKIDNYTQHSKEVFISFISSYKQKLAKLCEEKALDEGGV